MMEHLNQSCLIKLLYWVSGENHLKLIQSRKEEESNKTMKTNCVLSIRFSGTMIPPWIIVCKAYHHQHCLYQNRQIVSNQELPL